MIEALENQDFKKIWEEINWKVRHPEAKSLEEALEMESKFNDCLLFHTYINDSHIINSQEFTWLSSEIYGEDKGENVTLGRPITLFNVLDLLNTNKKDRIYIANGSEIHKIPVGKLCDFTSNLLEEQTHETWEKIYEIINQK